MVFTSDTSIADSSMLAGMRSTPSAWYSMPSPGSMCSSMMIFVMMVASVTSSLSGSFQPRLSVRLPCASASTSSTFLPCRTNPMPRLTAVVVLPTPPFWLAMAMTFDILYPPSKNKTACFFTANG